MREINLFKELKGLEKKKKYLIVATAMGVLFILCCIYIGNYYLNQQHSANVYKEIKLDVNDKDLTETELASTELVDFDELWAINPDIYAYILIPGTDISYPILQKEKDNSYYLNYTVNNVYGLPGSIYTENYNTKEFIDRNTVIYGHNMRDGSMFAQLYKYSDKAFLEENQYVYIYLPDRTLKYQIFAAVVFDDRHILANFDCTRVTPFQDYLSTIYNLQSSICNYNDQVNVDENDKIITLSTCMPNDEPDNRWLVEAVLIDE